MEGSVSAPSSAPSAPSSAAPGAQAQSTGGSRPTGTPQQSNSGGGQKSSTTPPPEKQTPSNLGSTEAQDYIPVKVNGRVIKMTREDAAAHASMAYAANERFTEAKKDREYAEGLKNKFKNNFIEALSDPELGLTEDQIRQKIEEYYHKKYIEPESLTPDQKRIKEYESKLAKYEAEEKAKQKKNQEDEETKLTTQQRDYLQKQIVEAMDASGLPKTKFFASRMAFYMRQNAINGWEAPIELIVKQVKNERQSIMSDMSQDATAEQLIGMLGDGVINKIRQHDLQKLRERRKVQPPTITSSNGGSRAGTGPMEGQRMSSRDVNQRLRDMRSGKFIPGQ